MAEFPQAPAWVKERLRAGLVIPAHPLALTSRRRLDERHQRALTRYYHAAGAGGIAVGVHTTQFEIRQPRFGLFERVLELAVETLEHCERVAGPPLVRIAGICGRTAQAVREGRFAREVGYHVGLLSLAAMKGAGDDALVRHCRAVARELPLMGFYLQPAVGGRVLSYRFWRCFVEIPNVGALKVAPFNRYQTIEVMRAVAESGRAGEVALYTGNDDTIVPDLLTEYAVRTGSGEVRVRMVGGLLGHWACWTRRAVELLAACQASWRRSQGASELLTRGAQVTACNAAIFDATHGFAGCLAGIQEVLRGQGLVANGLCLNPKERLSAGQRAEIERVRSGYPELTDDGFVRENLESWLRD